MLTQKTYKIAAKDGYQLTASGFEDLEVTPSCLVIINSAVGVLRTYYQPFAKFLANKGMVVISYDYRGVGDSLNGPVDQFKGYMHQWGEQDLAGVIDWVKQHYPDLPIKCVGHSVGAQMVGMADNNHHIDTLVAIAGQNGYWKNWQGKEKLKIVLCMFLLIPVISRILGYFPGKILNGCDLPGNVAREWAYWCRNKHFIVDQKGQPKRQYFNRYNGKAIFYSFYDDIQFAPRLAVDALSSLYPAAQKTSKHIEAGEVGERAIGHFGFFRSSFRKTLWVQILTLLKTG